MGFCCCWFGFLVYVCVLVVVVGRLNCRSECVAKFHKIKENNLKWTVAIFFLLVMLVLTPGIFFLHVVSNFSFLLTPWVDLS